MWGISGPHTTPRRKSGLGAGSRTPRAVVLGLAGDGALDLIEEKIMVL